MWYTIECLKVICPGTTEIFLIIEAVYQDHPINKPRFHTFCSRLSMPFFSTKEYICCVRRDVNSLYIVARHVIGLDFF